MPSSWKKKEKEITFVKMEISPIMLLLLLQFVYTDAGKAAVSVASLNYLQPLKQTYVSPMHTIRLDFQWRNRKFATVQFNSANMSVH